MMPWDEGAYLHAGADGAPHQIGKELDTIGDLSDLLAAGDARDDVEDAGDVLEGDHGADDAVVAFGRLERVGGWA